MLDFGRDIYVQDSRITLSGNMYYVSQRKMKPVTFLIFRIGTMTAGLVPFFNRMIKWFMAHILISRTRIAPVSHKREIIIKNDSIAVKDTVSINRSRLKMLESGKKFISIFMGSSRYFQKGELCKMYLPEQNLAAEIKSGMLQITDTVFWKSDGIIEFNRTIN